MADETPNAESEDSIARMRATADRFGPSYAFAAEILRGEGVDNLVKWVWRGLGGCALFVVAYAIVAS